MVSFFTWFSVLWSLRFLFQVTVILIFVQVGFCVISFFKSRQSKFTLQHDAHVFSTSFDFSCLSRTFRSPQFFFSTPILPVHPWIFLHHAFGPSLSIPHFLNSPSPLLNGASTKTFLPPHFILTQGLTPNNVKLVSFTSQ